MTGRLKSLLSVSEKYFSPAAEGGANNIFLEKPWGGAYRGRGAKWDENGIFHDPKNWDISKITKILGNFCFVCVEVLRPSQPNGVMSNHTFTGQA